MVTHMSARTHCGGPEDMSVSDKESSTVLFGLFELDAPGTVVCYSSPIEEKINDSTSTMV